MYNKIIIAGSGGQGALRIGQIIAYAGMNEGKEVSWLPSYGAEMRGGTANCNVIVSDTMVASPVVLEPNFAIVMNRPSFLKFEPTVEAGGTLVVNSSLVEDKSQRTDIKVYEVPANDIAKEEKNELGTNMVLLGAYVALTESVSLDSVYEIIDHSFTGAKAQYAESNKNLVTRGYDYIKAL